MARREYLYGDDDGGDEIDKRDEHPHQRAGKLLVLKRGRIESPRGTTIRRVHDVIAEREIGRERITRQGGEEQICRDGPVRPSRLVPALDHGPPEQKSRCEKGSQIGGDATSVSSSPAQRRPARARRSPTRVAESQQNTGCVTDACQTLHWRPANGNDVMNEALRQYRRKRQMGRREEQEGSRDCHDEQVLHHVDHEHAGRPAIGVAIRSRSTTQAARQGM